MTYVDRDNIQPGWQVWTSDGKELGTVVGGDQTQIRIKTGGLRSREVTVPREAVDEVETGRVELSWTKHEADTAAG